ncbi:hypothetical protein [Sutterella wadsworthensis]|uniref:hypothetical protein n=1 Tax=Sutterella wadsworthensis TaxID=40545 RepID=UPI003A9221F5
MMMALSFNERVKLLKKEFDGVLPKSFGVFRRKETPAFCQLFLSESQISKMNEFGVLKKGAASATPFGSR